MVGRRCGRDAGCIGLRPDQDYPSRPVRIIEGFGGGTPDLVSRLIGRWLAERLGQPFVVEERTGASSNITEAVVTASPDGCTLLNVVTANAINATLYEKLDFNFIRDIAPVAGLIRFPMVLLVNPSVPAATLSEFIAYAKANPGKINIASPGVGTPMHVAAELLKIDGRPRSRSRGLSRSGGSFHGSVRRTGPGLHHHRVDGDRSNQGWPPAGAGRDRTGAVRHIAGCSRGQRRDSRRRRGTESARQRPLPQRSSISSAPTSLRALPMQRSKRDSRMLAAKPCRCRPPVRKLHCGRDRKVG